MESDKKVQYKKYSDEEHSCQEYDYFEDWGDMPEYRCCPYMPSCPYIYEVTPNNQMYRNEYDFEDEFEDEYGTMPEHYRPRCRWPYRPCFYGGRWHCCRRRRPRPRPRPWWMY